MRRVLLLPLLAGCPAPLEEPCDGGDAAFVELGRALQDGTFTPYDDASSAPIETFDGEYGFEVVLRTTGLDTREPVVFVANVSADEDEPRSLFLDATLTCSADGTGALTVWIPLANLDQSHAGALALEGALLELEITVEDAAGDSDTSAISAPIDASALTTEP